MNSRTVLCAVACVLAMPASASEAATAQGTTTLSSVKKVYLGDFGRGEGADLVREKVRLLLASSGRFAVVESQDAADAVLTGAVAVEGKSVTYGTVNSGNGAVNTVHSVHAQGTLRLVHLKSQQAIWFFDTTRVWGFGNKAKLLAEKVVNALLEAAEQAGPFSDSTVQADSPPKPPPSPTIEQK